MNWASRANGVMLSSRAVVRAAGLAWAYLQTGENEFTRSSPVAVPAATLIAM